MLVAIQAIRAGIVSPASVRNDVAQNSSAPDDHFTAGPDRRVTLCVAVGALVVLVAVQLSVLGLYLPPVFDDTIIPPQTIISTAGPHRCVTQSGSGRIGRSWWLSNYPCWDCISRRCSYCSNGNNPRFRPRRSSHCRSTLPYDRTRAGGALIVLVAVQLSVLGLYLPPVLKMWAA